MHSCYSIERKYLKNDNLKQMKVEITAKEKSKLTSLVFRLEIQTTYWSSETCSELNQTSTMGLFRKLWSSLTGKFHRNDAVWLHENMMAAAHGLFFSSVKASKFIPVGLELSKKQFHLFRSKQGSYLVVPQWSKYWL